MPDYPHLKLPFQIEGSIKSSGGGGGTKSDRTIANEQNRQRHGTSLRENSSSLLDVWEETIQEKTQEGFELPNKYDIPVFLQIDTEVFPIDTLLNWGIEVVSEEKNGYIIGASFDNLTAFNENVQMFIDEKGIRKNTAAKIWGVEAGLQWRVNNIVKGELAMSWGEIQDNSDYVVELGVSCSVYSKLDYPDRTKFNTENEFQTKLAEFKKQELDAIIKRDAKQILRENEIEAYVNFYGGSVIDIWDNTTDAIFFKILISGKGLKDIVLTYQYLFNVEKSAQYKVENSVFDENFSCNLNILAPKAEATKVCVIDSGIQEGHRLLAPAIDSFSSRSYVNEDDSVADWVKQSGHGTKVAGAILYPKSIPSNGDYQLETIIQNARILDRYNRISDNSFSPQLMETIVRDFNDTRIFNLSVAENESYIGTHMPALAAAIDKIIYEKNVLFVISAGNIDDTNNNPSNPGIIEHLQQNREYPSFLNEETSKVACPGVSLFALTVGSISHADFANDDYKSLAGKERVSPFSRTGLGLWGTIKPDIVEYGGDFAKNIASYDLITHESICPELVNSTLHGAPLIGRDSVGTSFSAPKVTYIASKLQEEHPNETAQMYRALIVQSARLPEHCFNNPTHDDIRYYGYGVPNIDRALNNAPGRITFIQNGTLSPKHADIYKLNIPQELRGENNIRLLVEITLAFSAKTRLTRKGAHQYLSSWLEWQSSKYNEDFKSFRSRTIEYLDTDEGIVERGELDESANAIKWCLRENPRYTVNKINRNNSSIQKSWTILESHQFAKEFSIAVIGHKGWDKDLDNEIPYSICVSFEVYEGEANIYDILAEAQAEVTIQDQEIQLE